MILGFTGTRTGMTPTQRNDLETLMVERHITELHHGDCIGADAEAHAAARALGIRVVGHPPADPSRRAWCAFDEERTPLPYLERNHRIVDESELLFAAPAADAGPRSGTLATVRYAERVECPVVLTVDRWDM